MSRISNKKSETLTSLLQSGNLKATIILAIETSCDETSVAVVRREKETIKILSNIISSQVKLHAKWGGVVPNLAARQHLKNINHVFERAVEESGIKKEDVDAIAVTNGPGLIPALLVGVNFAKTISYLWKKPLLPIHHIEGHIYANFISNKISVNSNDQISLSKQIPNFKIQNLKANAVNEANEIIEFPAIVLVVSGGHTQLVLMKNHFEYKIVGQTLDDAAGEAFDKVARILNIGYPGGPIVSKLAENFDPSSNNYHVKFPRPLLQRKDLNFSFSGLKTAVLYETKKNEKLLNEKNYTYAICHEFQQAVIDVLVAKTIRAAKEYEAKTIMLAGGVSANKQLREQLKKKIENEMPQVSYLKPNISLTGDNAAMIGVAALMRWEKSSKKQRERAMDGWKKIQTDANLKLN